MPILIIASAIALLFTRRNASSGEDRASFLNPASVRNKLTSKLPEGATRDQALRIADELDKLAKTYHDAVQVTLEAYVETSARQGTSADDLIVVLEPLEQTRLQVLDGLLHIRQELLDLLSPSEWESVFGG